MALHLSGTVIFGRVIYFSIWTWLGETVNQAGDWNIHRNTNNIPARGNASVSPSGFVVYIWPTPTVMQRDPWTWHTARERILPLNPSCNDLKLKASAFLRQSPQINASKCGVPQTRKPPHTWLITKDWTCQREEACRSAACRTWSSCFSWVCLSLGGSAHRSSWFQSTGKSRNSLTSSESWSGIWALSHVSISQKNNQQPTFRGDLEKQQLSYWKRICFSPSYGVYSFWVRVSVCDDNQLRDRTSPGWSAVQHLLRFSCWKEDSLGGGNGWNQAACTLSRHRTLGQVLTEVVFTFIPIVLCKYWVQRVGFLCIWRLSVFRRGWWRLEWSSLPSRVQLAFRSQGDPGLPGWC